MRARIPRFVLFVALFLATQAPAFLHAAVHPAGGLDLGCEICLKGSGTGGIALPADAGPAAPPVAEAWVAPRTGQPHRAPGVARPVARGPPLLA
jgi:hypothetical protein